MTTQRSTLYTGPTAEDLDRIPADLKARPQWVLWRGEDRIDQQTGEVKLNKIPIDPQTLHNADTTDPTTWGTFEQCVAALPIALEEWEHENPDAYRGGGIGFVFAADDPTPASTSTTALTLTPARSPTGRRHTLIPSPATPR